VGVKIGPARVEDRDAVIALWRAVDLTRPWNDPGSDFDLALSNPTSILLVARNNSQLTGSIMIGFDGHRGWVYYLASDPTQRRKGIGRALMAAAEDWLRKLGCPKIQLMVRNDNYDAKGFYSAIGYSEQDVVTLGRRLDEPT
jgi:ribosomal protein S18 acetylase RimI-like enzyme